jgi:O-antigen/teichoic acid export membrane protein
LSNNTFSGFASGITSTGLGKVSVIMLGLLGLMITTRALTPQEVGTFVLLLALVAFLTEFSSLGLHLALPQFLVAAQMDDEKRRLTNTALLFRLLTVSVTSFIAFSASPDLLELFGVPLDSAIVPFIAVLVALESALKLSSALFQGQFKFRWIGVANCISSILNLAAILLFIHWLRMGLIGLIYAKLISRVTALLFVALVMRLDLRLELDLVMLRRMLIFGLPLQLNYIMSFIFQRMDTFVIGMLLGPMQVAYYEIARRIPDSLSEGYEAFVQVYFPFMSSFYTDHDTRRASAMLNTATRWLSFTTLSAALLSVAFGADIITLIFSDRYLPSAQLLSLLMVGAAVIFLDSNLGYALIAVGDGVKIPAINFIRTLLLFLGYFTLIPMLGLTGAALTGIVSMVLVDPLCVIFLRRRGLYVDVLAYMKAFLIFVAFALVFAYFKPVGLLTKCVSLALFALTNLALSVVTISDLRIVTRESRLLAARYRRRFNLGRA